jgi:serine/threonine protein phosphatase 1
MDIKKRHIIIGDIHGCINELNQLLELIDLKSSDTICFIGDLIDRGPDSVAVVKKCYSLTTKFDVKLILGNHEEKFLRYLHHLENKTGLEVQMSGTSEFPTLIEGLNVDELNFLKNAYYSLVFEEEGITLLHGGISNNIKFPFPANYQYGVHTPKQYKGLDLITKVRYLTPEGKFVSLNEETSDDSYWAEMYNGVFGHIYFGHQPFIQKNPENFLHATGLDTGCVFGGWLSAVILENGEKSVVSVKSKEIYSVKH